MGHLGETCSNGEPAWTRYVEQRDDWSTRDYVLYDTAPLFIGSTPLRILFPENTPVRILSNEYHEFDRRKWAFVQMGVLKGYVPLTKISKPHAGRVSKKESIAIQDLQDQLQSLDAINSPINVAICRGNTVAFWANGVSMVKTFEGCPKADFALQAANGDVLCYVSHKSGANAGRFQQYSGVSEKAGPEIYKHPEVQAFIDYVAEIINVNGKLPYTVAAPIRDPKLAGMAVFGPKFGTTFNEQNVNVIGQGQPQIVPYGDGYALHFDVEAAVNGKLDRFMADTSEYRAMLGAFPSSKDRSFKRNGRTYRYVRIGIYPNAFLKGRK